MSSSTFRGTLAAKDAPVGALVQVFGFEQPNDFMGKRGAFHEGRVRLVERVGGFLDTRVIFEDGQSVYARSYAVTRVQ